MLQILRKKFTPYCWLIIVHILLLMPLEGKHEPEMVFIPMSDKLIHFGLYAILTALWTIFIYQRNSLATQQKFLFTLLLVVLAIVDGIAIEFLQKTPWIHRDFDWFDAFADGVGAVAGIFIGRYLSRRLTA